MFRCFPASPQVVAYRAVIHGTASLDSSKLVSLIEEWTGQTAAIIVQRIILNLDSSCAIAIPSILFDEECPTRDTTQDSESSMVTTVSNHELPQFSHSETDSNSLTGAIIGGSTAAATLIVIAIVAIIIAVLIFKKCHSNKSSLQSRYVRTEMHIYG